MTGVTLPLVKTIQAEIDAAVKAIVAKHNCALVKHHIRYGGSSMDVSLSVAIKDSTGVAQTREHREFLAYCGMFGLKPEHLGKSVTVNGRRFKIVGLNVGAPKYPVQAERDDGRSFRLPIESVKRQLAA